MSQFNPRKYQLSGEDCIDRRRWEEVDVPTQSKQ
jgi:hypothetical protein